MENTDDNWASKAEDKDPPQSPYSVETPYGFHLDLDFLKYVDDIEKGNTIKRIPVRRKTKHPKFSTLPRNFSLPENGSNVYSSSLNKSFLTQRKTSLDAEGSRPLVTSTDTSSHSTLPQGPSYRKKALLIETVRQDPLPLEEETANCKGRPQLLRASSMPAKLLPIPYLEEETHQAAFLPSGFLRSSNGNGLELDFSPAKKPSELISSKRSPLTPHENLTDMKEQTNKAIQDSEKSPGLRREAQLLLDQQKTELPKEITQPSDSQQSQPLISQKFLEVVKSGEECHESQIYPSSVQSGLAPTGTSENMSVKQSQEEIELNICETVTEEAEEEDEMTGLSTREVGKNIELEPFLLKGPSNIRALQQHIAILEKQLNHKTEELEQIRMVLKQQDQEIKAKERSIELLASSKAQLEEKLCGENIKEIKPGVQARNAPQYFDVAVNTEHVHEKVMHEKEISVSITELVEPLGGDTYEADNKNVEICKVLLSAEISGVTADDGGRDEPTLQRNEEGERIVQESDCSIVEPSYDELHVGNENKTERNPLTLFVPGGENGSAPKTADIKSKGMQIIFQEDAQREQEEQNHQEAKESPTDPIVGQYIKKIQDLLQEQWLCLEHGYPELASAIKHPASKLSSIQNQLVNSLNLLLSAYSAQTPTDQENSNTQYQQLEISPSTSLKSIMKKKEAGFHEGSNGTKKNLQFVGVNGGYETTSSEDSSCEENSSEGDSDNEMDRKHGNEEQSWGEEVKEDEQSTSATPPSAKKDRDPGKLEETTQSTMQDKAERFRPSGDFLKGCQILSKNLSEIRTTKDKFLRHVLSTVCQEWFRISSRKSSSSGIVAAYLQEIEAVHPHLQSVIVNLADGNGNTALHYSVSHSNFWIVKLLLETGVCDVDYQNKAGYTAVMITPLASAETEEEMEVVKKLLQEGNVNIRASQGGQTALILGVSHDREDMVKALLSCNADINLQDEDGLSPLMVASQHGNLEMVKLLLSHSGCDPALVDKAGNSALSLALKSSHMEIVEFLRTHIHHTQSLNT
ncbi:KN motif and ankyrin repeat domain-containing protein 4 [Pituophis catenifer annectens]|uniref:KN motif and ankyrin repeat domain-containing protein 4 n=1 Tax=Pituophis catenifer annectens TaxID=94852 RepID=UPI00399584F7